jgi:hypothetical protein
MHREGCQKDGARKGIVNALVLVHLLREEPVNVPESLQDAYARLEVIASEPA